MIDPLYTNLTKPIQHNLASTKATISILLIPTLPTQTSIRVEQSTTRNEERFAEMLQWCLLEFAQRMLRSRKGSSCVSSSRW